MQPGPYSGWAPPPPPNWAQPQWAQPKRSRKPMWIALAVAAVVLASVGAIFWFGRSDGTASPGAAVKRYLQALAAGDARAALALGVEQPTATDFLTNDTLKQQLAKWPISNIKILDNDATAKQNGRVHVTATFGSQTSDATIEVTHQSGGWRLKATTVQIAPAKALAIFGKPVSAAASVFPGWVDFGSSNTYVTVTATPPLLEALSPNRTWPITPAYKLTEQGRTAVRDQLTAAVTQCEHSNLLAPPGCPMHLNAGEFIEGSAAWSQFDTSAVSIGDLNGETFGVFFTGQITFTVSARTTLGVPKIGSLTRPLKGTADMTKTPPELSFG